MAALLRCGASAGAEGPCRSVVTTLDPVRCGRQCYQRVRSRKYALSVSLISQGNLVVIYLFAWIWGCVRVQAFFRGKDMQDFQQVFVCVCGGVWVCVGVCVCGGGVCVGGCVGVCVSMCVVPNPPHVLAGVTLTNACT